MADKVRGRFMGFREGLPVYEEVDPEADTDVPVYTIGKVLFALPSHPPHDAAEHLETVPLAHEDPERH